MLDALRDNRLVVPNIVLPPTQTILRIADLIERASGRFLLARSRNPPTGEFESEIEAMNLFNLVVRYINAITELARIDLVLAPSADVLARAVFETALRAAWMVTPSDPFDREVRWLAHLEEEERMLGKIAERANRFGGDPARFQEKRDVLHAFRVGVTAKLPPGYKPLPGNPSVERMLEEIGQKQVYPIYSLLSSYVHGSHAATSVYQKNLGTLKEHGEFIDEDSWRISLWTSWKNLYILGSYMLDRLGATDFDFTEDDQHIEAELQRLSTKKEYKH